MLIRTVNTSILALIVITLVTGLIVLFANQYLWLMDVHRIASWGLIALVPWKVGIALASMKRGFDWSRFDRGAGIFLSLLLAVLAAASIVLALMWAWRLGPYMLWLYQTVIAWHWIVSLVLVIPLAVHVWRHWPKPRLEEFTSRRGLLRSGGIAVAGVLGWLAAERLAQGRATEEEPRRITGSRGRGEFTGNDFPITGEWVNPIDLSTWRLSVTGTVTTPLTLGYEELLALGGQARVATLDCTLGWYTTQEWRGIPLSVLLDRAEANPEATGVILRSVSGYGMPFTRPEFDRLLLCTHIGDEVLDHRHGYPVRAVAPHRRGWFWVKWLAAVEVVTALPDLSATIDRIEKTGAALTSAGRARS